MPKTAAQARPENLKHTLRCLLSYMGHAKISLGIVSVLAVVSALANLLGTYMINPVVTALTTGHAARLGLAYRAYRHHLRAGRGLRAGLHADYGSRGAASGV